MRYLILIITAFLSLAAGCPQDKCIDTGLPEISSFEVSPDTLEMGESAGISWIVKNASRVRIEPDIGDVGLEGTTKLEPAGSRAFTLFAENDCGNVQKTVSLTVLSVSSTDNSTSSVPFINYFTAKPEKVWAGAGTKLSWQVSNATLLSIHWDPHEMNLKTTAGGSAAFYPVVPTTYILVATNSIGNTIATVKVEIISSIGTHGGGDGGGGGG